MNWQQETNFQTNMSHLVGYAKATVKELSDPFYSKHRGPEWVSEKLRELSDTMEHVWANRYDRVVDLKEYSDPSLRIPLEK